MKRWIAVILCVCGLLSLLSGCSGEEPKRKELEAIRQAGILKIGVTPCAPFCQKGSDGSWKGFDIELAKLVCDKLELRPEFVEVQWDDRTRALDEGQVDCLWSGLTARTDLTGQMDLSQTYLASAPVLVIPAEEEMFFQVSGSAVAVEIGSAGEAAIGVCLPGAASFPLASQQKALEAVLEGKTEAAVVDRLVAQVAVANAPTLLILDTDLGTQEMAVALRKDSDLTPAINSALEQLEKDGILSELAMEYGMTESLIMG